MYRPTSHRARRVAVTIALAAIAATVAATGGASAQTTPPIAQYQAQTAYGNRFPCDPSLWGPDINIIVSNAKVIRGTSGDDVICGGKAANRIVATQGGDDKVFGGGGKDRIRQTQPQRRGEDPRRRTPGGEVVAAVSLIRPIASPCQPGPRTAGRP